MLLYECVDEALLKCACRVSLRAAIVSPGLGIVSVIKEPKHHRTKANARARSFGVQV